MQRTELCSNRCCPTVAKETDGDTTQWIITDDFGGKVLLTDQQLENLINIITEHKSTTPYE